MSKYIWVLLILVWACSTPGSKENASPWEGEWSATWVTDSAAYSGLHGITAYTMPGKITFDSDSINIQAYGFDGCVFGHDTLDHTMKWKIRHDSLILINDPQTPGMIYHIREMSESKMHLQLMEDIYVLLERKS